MTLRARLLASTTVLGLTGLLSNQAHAGLLGAGNTVQAFYYNGVFASPEGEIPVAGSTSDPASLTAAVDYQSGAADGSTIAVNDLQISITNQLAGFPFCVGGSSGTACTDVVDGFDFRFTGENIVGVSVDPASAADFQPVGGTFQGNTHLGLQLLGPNEIQVDVTGDAPAQGDPLVIDLSFSAAPPPADAPEPATLVLLGSALAGLTALRRRRKY